MPKWLQNARNEERGARRSGKEELERSEAKGRKQEQWEKKGKHMGGRKGGKGAGEKGK